MATLTRLIRPTLNGYAHLEYILVYTSYRKVEFNN